jgi:hypothetical protein
MIDESLCTPWFKGTISPHHEGVYQREFVLITGEREIKYALFLNGHWFMSSLTVDGAEAMTEISHLQICSTNAPPWRGLKEKP